jgi:hypothetical protein
MPLSCQEQLSSSPPTTPQISSWFYFKDGIVRALSISVNEFSLYKKAGCDKN